MPPTEDPLQLVGTTIDEKYRVEAVVGEGGFALVYKATHLLWQRPVALKVFRALGDAPEATRAALMEGFLEEGRLLADLSERSAVFVQSRDVGQLKSKTGAWMPYLVLEWLEGETLESMIQRRTELLAPPMSFEEAIDLLQPVGEGLALAHARGIAHRDVKPANIFLVGDIGGPGPHAVKLLDLGIAKVVQDSAGAAGGFTKTQGTMTSFTPMYGAPEQFSRTNGPTGPWTDVFALALVILELAGGVPALAGSSLTEVGWKACNPAERPGPKMLGIPASAGLEQVFEKALAVQTTNRFASVGELWSALRSTLGMSEAMGAGRGAESMQRMSAKFPISATAPAPPSVRIVPAGLGNVSGDTQLAPSLVAPPVKSSGSKAALGGAIGVGVVALVGGLLFFVTKEQKTNDANATVDAAPQPVAMTVAPGDAGDAALATTAPLTCPTGMIPIPGGKFYMGSDDTSDDVKPSERPAHQVMLKPYCIDRLEVTTHDYVACSKSGECKRAPVVNDFDGLDRKHDKPIYDALCTANDPDKFDRYPINCVDWDMADHFCQMQQKRLPTEAEWEFAARGPDGRKYPWGDDKPGIGWLNACGSECAKWGAANGIKIAQTMYDGDDGFPNSAPVGSFPKGASRYGVEDVVGNVWEWVADWFAPYDAADVTMIQNNPTGPASPPAVPRKTIRGGSWNGEYASWVRPSFRYHAGPKQTSYGVGFRCAK